MLSNTLSLSWGFTTQTLNRPVTCLHVLVVQDGEAQVVVQKELDVVLLALHVLSRAVGGVREERASDRQASGACKP